MNKSQSPVLVIFGVTGDLSKRKLLPALYSLFKSGVLGEDTKIIGTSRKPIENAEITGGLRESVGKNEEVDENTLNKLESALQTIQVNQDNEDDYVSLKELLNSLDKGVEKLRLFYMSVPSSAYEVIVDHLAHNELNDKRSRVLLEKPFGQDLESAKSTITNIQHAFNEDQIYRIDHYLAKEVVQNLLVLRTANPFLDNIWNSQNISRITVRQFETLGIEGRANFYEQTGALRDMTQSHLLQVLATCLMSVPTDLSSDAAHNSKQQALSSLEPINPAKAIRAQYSSYKEEVDNPNSFVETYVKLPLESNDPRWQGTELCINQGKAVDKSLADVTVDFKPAANYEPGQIVFNIQPDESITMKLNMKTPGLSEDEEKVSLSLDYSDVFKSYTKYDAYQKVIVDSIEGDQSLFASDQEVIACWEVIEPLVKAWGISGDNLKFYEAGSSGPEI